jgi:hypothetical protein
MYRQLLKGAGNVTADVGLFYVLLTVHHSRSVQRNQRDALFIQFIKNYGKAN